MLAARCTMRTFLFTLVFPSSSDQRSPRRLSSSWRTRSSVYTISPDAGNVAFVDRATGTNHLARPGVPRALVSHAREGTRSHLQPRWRKGT